MNPIKALLCSLRCWMKTRYINYLISRYNFVGWPSIKWQPGVKKTITREEKLDAIIEVIKKEIEMLKHTNEITNA